MRQTVEAPLCGMVRVTSEVTDDCQRCKKQEGEVNHPRGCVFVGWGLGWQPCTACGATGSVRVEQYEGWQLCAGEVAWSVGATPEVAVGALCRERGWGEPTHFSPLDSDADSGFDWGRRFVADGTSFKAAGVNVPGGTVLTWWK